MANNGRSLVLKFYQIIFSTNEIFYGNDMT